MIKDLIETHALLPHPEGGYYKETYRSEFSTGIFYLLSAGEKSSLHRIKSDEMWHFYSGDALIVAEITESGEVKETRLDKDNVQYVVPSGVWFGAYLPEGAEFAFVGCTVAPAFHFKDFEMGDKALLLKEYPKAQRIIDKLLSNS
jgi:predicted cupin superfamily sugar epimerase